MRPGLEVALEVADIYACRRILLHNVELVITHGNIQRTRKCMQRAKELATNQVHQRETTSKNSKRSRSVRCTPASSPSQHSRRK